MLSSRGSGIGILWRYFSRGDSSGFEAVGDDSLVRVGGDVKGVDGNNKVSSGGSGGLTEKKEREKCYISM